MSIDGDNADSIIASYSTFRQSMFTQEIIKNNLELKKNQDLIKKAVDELIMEGM